MEKPKIKNNLEGNSMILLMKINATFTGNEHGIRDKYIT